MKLFFLLCAMLTFVLLKENVHCNCLNNSSSNFVQLLCKSWYCSFALSSSSSVFFFLAQSVGFSVLFCKLGTFIMWEWVFRIRIRKKHHYEWWLSWCFYSSHNHCYDVLFLRNSSLLTFLLIYVLIYLLFILFFYLEYIKRWIR